MTTRRNFTLGLCAVASAAGTARAQAQTSRRYLTLVIPYPPGGSTDILGRMFAAALGNQLGESVIVENRAGASGVTGASHVAGMPADGRTILLGVGNLMLNQEFLLKDNRFSPLQALQPVARISTIQTGIFAAASHPARDLREFLAMAGRKPGAHSFAYYGDLGVPAMAVEAKIQLLRVPYKGGAPALLDVAAGNVDILLSSLAQAMPLVKAGKLKLLAPSTAERSAEFPDLPTVKELVPGFAAIDYNGIFVPRATPPDTVDALWQAASRVVANDDFRRAIAERGFVAAPLAPGDFEAFLRRDQDNIRKTVLAAGIQPE
ncbi:MAG: Bug family tripartite tricarboxylate transporter substrate binding protein [Lautropia sp.]